MMKIMVDGEAPPPGMRAQPIYVKIRGVIDGRQADAFEQQMAAAAATGQSVIPVLIDSPGGSVLAGNRMLALMDAQPLPVATICDGIAMSMGAVLLAAGTPGLRYAVPNATIMIHQVSSSAQGKVAAQDTSISESNRLNEALLDFIAERTGADAGRDYVREDDDFYHRKLAALGNQDMFWTVHEAVKDNLVNSGNVRLPAFTINVSRHDESVGVTFDDMSAEELAGFAERKRRPLQRMHDPQRLSGKEETKITAIRDFTAQMMAPHEIDELFTTVRKYRFRRSAGTALEGQRHVY